MLFSSLIWDFDGTLFNTYPHMIRSMRRGLADCGLNPPEEEVFFWMKQSVTQTLNHFQEQDPSRTAKLGALYQRHEKNDSRELIRPYDGIPELLRETIALGGRHYVYTHRGATVYAYLDAFGLTDCFSGFITADDGFPAKPAPDALLHLLAQYAVDPHAAVMIGDRDIDVLAGVNASIAGILFDPDHCYDAFETPLRCASVGELRNLLVSGGTAAS